MECAIKVGANKRGELSSIYSKVLNPHNSGLKQEDWLSTQIAMNQLFQVHALTGQSRLVMPRTCSAYVCVETRGRHMTSTMNSTLCSLRIGKKDGRGQNTFVFVTGGNDHTTLPVSKCERYDVG